MTDPGAGYSVRLDAEMWMRDHLAEAYDVVPHGYLDAFEQQERAGAKRRALVLSYKKGPKNFFKNAWYGRRPYHAFLLISLVLSL